MNAGSETKESNELWCHSKTPMLILAGAPMAGKSVCVQLLGEYLTSCGIDCHIIPEAATMVLEELPNAHERADFQTMILSRQLASENQCMKNVMTKTTNKQQLIILDRCGLDCMVFFSEDSCAEAISNIGYSSTMLENRYEQCLVAHMTTFALSAKCEEKHKC